MVRSTIADAQVEFAGLWVALKDGKVVEGAADAVRADHGPAREGHH